MISSEDPEVTDAPYDEEARDASRDVPVDVFIAALKKIGFHELPGHDHAFRLEGCTVVVPTVTALRPSFVSGESRIVRMHGLAEEGQLEDVVSASMAMKGVKQRRGGSPRS